MIVCTPRLEDYRNVVNYSIEHGCMWGGGTSNICERNWNVYKENTCIRISSKILRFSSHHHYCIAWGEDRIISVEEFFRKIRIQKIFDEFK